MLCPFIQKACLTLKCELYHRTEGSCVFWLMEQQQRETRELLEHLAEVIEKSAPR
jgi:hypothetical protein